MSEEPLSYFVKYKNSIDDISILESSKYIESDISNTLHTLAKSDFNNETLLELEKVKKNILSEISKFNDVLDKFKDDTIDYITERESSYLSKSYTMYENGRSDTSEYILDRSLFKSLIYKEHIEKYCISRINKYSNWKHAGLFIRPEHGKYVDEMTASDPLYVVDEHLELLTHTKKLWNPEYQARVRYRIIDESRNIILKDIPSSQIGFAMVMNFFNYKPLEVVEQYVTEIYDLLKPGGVLMFTYNNCNLALAVQNFEKSLYSYTPESRLSPLLNRIGFKIIKSYNEPITNVSWLEVKKPGDINSIRGGQCLAKINI